MVADSTEEAESSMSRDLLRRFGGGSSSMEQQEVTGGGDSDEIELSLGLSLGGSFGADVGPKKITRSSSVAAFIMFPKKDVFVPAAAPLARTSSLPVETEEEFRKRKEVQCLKRMEAKRKRSEKRCASGGLATAPKVGRVDIEIGGCSGFEGGKQLNGVHPWEVAASRDKAACFPPVSQSSIGSQGSNSSDVESRQNQGFDSSGFISSTETKSLLTIQSLPGRSNHITSASPPTSFERRAGGDKEAPMRRNSEGNMEKTMMDEMPCVSTTGEGPNGRRIEGFLYKYRRGEEVRIVCVCHGRFLTPAEFVKHAGGSDVAHPLRHIVVKPSPSALLS